MSDINTNTSNRLKVSVLQFEFNLYEGTAEAVSSINEKGLFDVLPKHANFITLVNKKLTIHESAEKKREFKIDSGILKVINNQVTIFLGIASEQNKG